MNNLVGYNSSDSEEESVEEKQDFQKKRKLDAKSLFASLPPPKNPAANIDNSSKRPKIAKAVTATTSTTSKFDSKETSDFFTFAEPEKLSVSSKSKELNTSIPTPLVYDKDVGPQLPSKSDTPVYYETYDYSYNTNVTSLQNEDGNEAIESSNTSNNPPLEDTELVRLAGRKAIKSGDVQIKDIALADQLDNSYEMEVLRNASKERDKIRSTMAGAHRQQPVGRRRNLTTLVNQALIRDADMQEAAATRRAMQKKIRAQYGF